MMPFSFLNAGDLAKWLAPESGKTISIGHAWLPNERIVGLFGIEKNLTERGSWSQILRPSLQPQRHQLKGRHAVGELPLTSSFSRASLSMQTGAMASVFSKRGTSVAIARTVRDVEHGGAEVAASLPSLENKPPAIGLVQRFLETEISTFFELIAMLDHGVAVHHADCLRNLARSWNGSQKPANFQSSAPRRHQVQGITSRSHGFSFPASHVASQTFKEDSKCPNVLFEFGGPSWAD